MLFGFLAGENAAKYAAADTTAPETETCAERTLRDYPALGEDTLRDLREELRDTMWKDVSVVRTEAGMREALGKIEEIKAAMARRRPASLAEWMELRNLCFTAERVTRAALERKESLGAHYRADQE